jgi:hypothetical protein
MKRYCTKIPFIGRRVRLSMHAPRVAVGTLTLMLGLATIIAPPRVTATPICAPAIILPTNATVYIFDANNNAVLSPYASVFEGGVFTDAGFIGTVDADFNIVDANNVIIGYVTYPSPG